MREGGPISYEAGPSGFLTCASVQGEEENAFAGIPSDQYIWKGVVNPKPQTLNLQP